jgi:hypothetical protein
LAELAIHSIEPPPGHVSYTDTIRTLYGGGYTKTQFLLDVYAGRIRISSRVDDPRLCDLYFDYAEALECSWSSRMDAIVLEDRYWVKHRVVHMIETLWPECVGRGIAEGQDFWRRIREDGRVRTKTLVNTSEGRSRPLYHYSLTDCLSFAALTYGASISRCVDMRLADHVAPLS